MPDPAGNLFAFHRIKPLMGTRIRRAVTGGTASHSMLITEDGRCLVFGKNNDGQLGLGDTRPRHIPTPLELPNGERAVDCGIGRNFTIVLTESGAAYGFGFNKRGECGIGNTSDKVLRPTPVKISSKIVKVACGDYFTIIIDEAGRAFSFGHPEKNVLGHGTDYQFIETNKVSFAPQPTPKPVRGLEGKKITMVACGNQHSVAVDDQNHVFSWGFNGYGRLGTGDTKDQPSAVELKSFKPREGYSSLKAVACGAAVSMAILATKECYMWGQVKKTGDSWMTPKSHPELAGWDTRAASAGSSTYFVAADKSTICWGMGSTGELGLGVGGPKSSANPRKVDGLEGLVTLSVSAGQSHTLVVVDADAGAAFLEKFPVYEPEEKAYTPKPGMEAAAGGEEGAEKKKGRGRAPGGGAAAPAPKKAKPTYNEEDELGTDSGEGEPDPDDDEWGKSKKKKAKGKGKGKGKGGR
eukprot:tig00020801_g13957.t1